MNRKKLSVVTLFTIILSLMTFLIPATPVGALDIELSPDYGNVGEEVYVNYLDWVAGSYYIYFDSTQVVPKYTSSSDSPKHFAVPKCSSGTHTVSLRTNTTSTSTVASATFKVESDITLSPKSAKVGDKITIDGTGFLVSNTVAIYFNNDNLKDVEADSYGSFNTTITVPDTPYGSYDISAEDIDNSANEALAIIPKIVVSNTSPAVGDKITLSGAGFSALSSVTIALDGIIINTTASSDVNGTLPEKQITIPDITSGSHTLSVKDSHNHSVGMTVTIIQAISVNPKNGPTETDITVNGTGFVPNTPITISYKGITIATSPAIITSDDSGSFTAVIKAPNYAAGVYTVTALQGSLTSNTNFTLTSTADLDKTSGAVGSMVTASGSGYASGAKINIKYDLNDLTSATADGSGSFSTTFIVPPGAAGEHKIVITDSINPTAINFTVTAAALLSESTGNVNSDLTINGYAFAPGSAITIKYDSTNIGSATADASGSFSTNIKVPASKGGNHTIIITDGNSVTSTAFSVETTPPAEPKLILPINGDQSDALAKFQWNLISDPSGPVTYTLQVSQDPAFTSLVLEKTGLTTNSFQLTQDQKLKNTEKNKPYYWRVIAIDSASNESGWSTAQTFTVGSSFPNWLMITIYVFVGIILLLAGFILGGRLKNRT